MGKVAKVSREEIVEAVKYNKSCNITLLTE
jgi:hypothetical protein